MVLSDQVSKCPESEENITDEYSADPEVVTGLGYESEGEIESVTDQAATMDNSQFMRNLALFYLKLQAKFLLPASTIQTIVEEMGSIHNLGLSIGLKTLSERLSHLNVDEIDVKELLKDFYENNPFHICNTGQLRSDKTRQTYFRTNFRYVQPAEIYLGLDKNKNVPRYA